MNQFKGLLLATALFGSVCSAYAFPFFHGNGLMGGLISEGIAEEEHKIASAAYQDERVDTVPQSLEAHILSLEKAEKKLTEELLAKNWQEVEKSIQTALAKINSGEIERTLAKAMESIEQSKQQLAKELKELDIKKLSALTEKEMNAQLKALDKEMQQLKIEIQQVKADTRQQQQNLQRELKRTLPSIEQELKKAKEEIRSTQETFIGYQEMIADMSRNGLLTDVANYRIEYDGSSLLIDGKLQPANVFKKYMSYFKGKKIVLQNKQNKFDILTDRD